MSRTQMPGLGGDYAQDPPKVGERYEFETVDGDGEVTHHVLLEWDGKEWVRLPS